MGNKSDGHHIQYHSDNHIMDSIQCPFCKKDFDGTEISYKDFNIHLQKCGLLFVKINKPCDLFSTNEDPELAKLIFNYSKQYTLSKQLKKKSKIGINQKLDELKKSIQSRKISWEKGFCQLDLTRDEILVKSMEQIEKVDLFKELKINFIGEICYDAGGIIREWFTIIFRTLEGNKLKLFIPSDNDNFSYNINPFLKHNNENFKYFNFIGKLIGKALLDNITLNICFNKMIYKMMLQEDIIFEDLKEIDTQLYNSLKNLKSNPGNDNDKNIEDLGIYYNIEMKDVINQRHSLDLIENGKNIIVKNIDDYINKRIQFLKGIYEPFIQKIRDGLFKIIPKDKIQILNSDEFDLVLNGKPFIDLEEWKENTHYKRPYFRSHKVIRWFWEVLGELTQKQLSNFLMFSTGSSRVPYGGFNALESNRGNKANFTIESIQYNFGVKNYIKAHTCFNRIDLPLFPNKEELKEAVNFVSFDEIIGFGID